MDKENKLILYKDDEGRVNVNVRFADEDVWLTQAQLAEIYYTTQENISMHISGIYKDNELEASRTLISSSRRCSPGKTQHRPLQP